MPKIKTIFLVIILTCGLVLLLQYFLEGTSKDNSLNILYYSIISAIIGANLIARYRGNLSSSIVHAFIWGVSFIALILLYSFRSELVFVKDRVVSTLLPSMAITNKNGELEFRASLDGHFYVNALVNNVPVKFILDTGSSDVVIPPHLAKKLGFDIDNLQFTKIYMTANGQGYGAPITIKALQINEYRFHDIKASVNEKDMETPLLGMSFLETLYGYEVKNGILILKP